MAPFNPGEPVAEENPMPVSIIMGSGAYLPGEPVSDTNPCPVKIVEGSAGGVTTGAFVKASRLGPVFTAPTGTTLNILAGTEVEVGGSLQSFASDTAVVMPTLTAGTNYAIYVCTDGTVRADADLLLQTGIPVMKFARLVVFILHLEATPRLSRVATLPQPSIPTPFGMNDGGQPVLTLVV